MKPSAKGQVGNALVNATHGSMDTCFVTKNKQDTCRILLSKEEEEKKQTNTNPLSYCSQHVWIKFQLTFVSEYWSNLQTFLTLFVKCENFTSSLFFFTVVFAIVWKGCWVINWFKVEFLSSHFVPSPGRCESSPEVWFNQTRQPARSRISVYLQMNHAAVFISVKEHLPSQVLKCGRKTIKMQMYFINLFLI